MNKIKHRRRRNKLRFFLNIIALLPLELWIYLLSDIDKDTKIKLLKIFRSNRLLRIDTMVTYYLIENEDIKHNPLSLELHFSNLMVILTVLGMTCLIINVGRCFEENMNEKIGNLDEMSSLEKLKFFIRYYYIAFALISRIAQDVYFPIPYELLILFTALMCLVPIITTWILLKSVHINFKVNDLKLQYRKKTETMFYFLQREDVSETISFKTRRYINMCWLHYQGIIVPKLLLKSPMYYKEKYFGELYSEYINNNEIFSGCSYDFKRQVITSFTVDLYFKGDYITYKKLINHTMYFVHEGELLAYDEIDALTETFVKELKTKSCLGLPCGYKYKIPHQYSYRAKKNCIVLALNYHSWKHLTEFFPHDSLKINKTFEAYCRLRHINLRL